MPVEKAGPAAIKKAAEIIQRGGLVAFPTETVYGLGADALNPAAIRKIYRVKNRPSANPLIVHLAEIEKIAPLVKMSALSRQRLEKLARFWPGPLTVVLERSDRVPAEVSAKSSTVAVRIPDHPVARSLIQTAGRPLAAPSANPSGYISPTTAAHVEEHLGGQIDLILDGGPCAVGIESAVISLVSTPPVLLRPGFLTKETLAGALAEEVELGEDIQHQSPGTTGNHYSPRTPLRFIDEITPAALEGLKIGVITFTRESGIGSASEIRLAGPSGSGLYAAMRELDKSALDLILVERPADAGVGAAILDRLKRASHGGFKG